MNFIPQLSLPISEAQFMRQYWQKKPLLIRQAFKNFQPLLTRDELFSLAQNDEVESRLVNSAKAQWDLQHGPLFKLPKTKKHWTLLVQGVNLFNASANALLQQFRFISDTRLDDLMISYAVDQGSVGAHVDSYDVFLLQAHGQRRWQISQQKTLDCIPDLPVKILKKFIPEEEWILEPGDMLYLPPNYAHYGVAQGECMTYSIGFRAPAYQEFAQGFIDYLADKIALDGQLSDPDLRATRLPAQIDSRLLQKIGRQLQNIRWTQQDVANFVGQFLSEPKDHVIFEPPKRVLSRSAFSRQLKKHGCALALKTRMLYHGKKIFINGEFIDCKKSYLKVLRQLAHQRYLSPQECAGFFLKEDTGSFEVIPCLYDVYRAGWVTINSNN